MLDSLPVCASPNNTQEPDQVSGNLKVAESRPISETVVVELDPGVTAKHDAIPLNRGPMPLGENPEDVASIPAEPADWTKAKPNRPGFTLPVYITDLDGNYLRTSFLPDTRTEYCRLVNSEPTPERATIVPPKGVPLHLLDDNAAQPDTDNDGRSIMLDQAEKKQRNKLGPKKEDGTLRLTSRDKYIVSLRDSSEEPNETEQVYCCETLEEAANFCHEWEKEKGEFQLTAEIHDRAGNLIVMPVLHAEAIEVTQEEIDGWAPKYPVDMPGVILGNVDYRKDLEPVFDLERMTEITTNLNWAFGEVFGAGYQANSCIGGTNNIGGLVMLTQDWKAWHELGSEEYNLDATSQIPLEEQALSILRKWSNKFDQAISNVMTLRYKLDAKQPATPNWRDEFNWGDEDESSDVEEAAPVFEGGHTEPHDFYANSVRFEPRKPGMMQLREGQATCIFRNEDDPYEKGPWTDGYGNFWFADGAFERDRDSDDMDIIGPWPGCGFRLLGKGEPWAEGDSHYDVNSDTWVDGEPSDDIPVYALFVRRVMLPSLPQSGNQALPAKAANLLNEAAAHPKSGFEPLPSDNKVVPKTKTPNPQSPKVPVGPLLRPDQLAFFDQAMLRGMDALLARHPHEICEAAAGEPDFNEYGDSDAEEHCNEIEAHLRHPSSCAWLLLGERERQIQRASRPTAFTHGPEHYFNGQLWEEDGPEKRVFVNETWGDVLPAREGARE